MFFGEALANDGREAETSPVWIFSMWGKFTRGLLYPLCSPDASSKAAQNPSVSQITMYANNGRQPTRSGWPLPTTDQRAQKTPRMTYSLWDWSLATWEWVLIFRLGTSDQPKSLLLSLKLIFSCIALWGHRRKKRLGVNNVMSLYSFKTDTQSTHTSLLWTNGDFSLKGCFSKPFIIYFVSSGSFPMSL